MKPYEKYKESGIEWIGNIPKHWSKLKIGRTFRKIGSGTTPNTNTEKYYKDGNINWLNTGDLNDSYITSTKKKITQIAIDEISTLKLSSIDSIVIALYGATIGKLGHLKIETTTNQACCVLSESEEIENRYLFYFLMAAKDFIISKAYGGGQPNISQDLIKQLYITAPSQIEQAAIAKYLDHQTAIIDELIEKKTKQIALLKEKRQAIINETITKGLDPTAKMKDSGIEWLGEIPENWEVKKLKFVYNIKKQIAGELGYNVLSVTQKGIKIRDLDNLKGQLSMDYSKYQLVEKGDFIMNHMDLLTGFIDISNWNGVTSPDYRVFHSIDKNCIDEYYLFIFQFCYSNKIFFGLGQGVSQLGRWRMPAESFNNFIVPYPSKEEQQQIVDFLIEYTKSIDETIEKQLVAIEKLKEYRQSLISEAVTGKIDVRDWQKN